ncbi:hypothetical protein DAPPUDRAFT_313551 [Daphnia pulex]|uniref:AMP-dependent synthetase/ligase domain-containing protein n=1 Tax=Daphnia pulex TaxID=6669 RepID=E9G3G2_DAPPU|nr:hypothetical protein DAPPUDRAFT_313551 [Daphnia pulex]|eukprot:EFX85769.1 hypothetical protein DAPPUDRAFT_313551 [Daphnia pulex]
MTVTGRKHNTDDIIATVLAVEPMKFIYRGRIAVFSIRVLRDERICVIAEQRPDCSEEESFQWMSRVLQAVDSIHQVGIYCLALVPPNSLPKTPLGGIHLSETRRRFMEGSLHPANVLMCPHTCVTNLPKPREVHQGQCGDSHLGEIWVQAPHNASGYFTLYGDDPAGAGAASVDHFNSRLVTGTTGEAYARTGYLGFLRRTESVQSDGELHDAVFVVGALEETVVLRGMRYHPIDIENTVMRCHQKIAECAVFTWTNLLVVVVELEGTESEALDLVPLVTSSVLEEHQLIVGVVVVVDPGVVPINSRGEKQRMHLRDGFLADQLDPIYVAYNM